MKYYKGYFPTNECEYYAVVSNYKWYYFSKIRREWAKPVTYSNNWKEWVKSHSKSRFEEISPLEVVVVCGCLFD